MIIKEVSQKYDITQDTLRYYERIGMIPPVHRTPSGIRDYQESDLSWIELAICMRNAGLPIETMIEYVALYQKGDSTLSARLELLQNQRRILLEQKKNGCRYRSWPYKTTGHFIRRKNLRSFVCAVIEPPFGVGPHAEMGYDFLGVHRFLLACHSVLRNGIKGSRPGLQK